MSIPPELYDHPVVRECIDEAYRRIDAWPVTQHENCIEAKKLLTNGWDGIALMEILVEPLLELRGITSEDIDVFEMMITERNYCIGETNRGALYEEWDAERARTKDDYVDENTLSEVIAPGG